LGLFDVRNGNKVSFGLALLIAASVGYCSLPLTSYAILIVSVTNQNAPPIPANRSASDAVRANLKSEPSMADLTATYLDRTGTPIVTITPKSIGSWGNNLQWYTHSSNSNSIKRPEDAQQAVAVRIEAKGCDPQTIPVKLDRTYIPLSFSPHGGGPASIYFKFNGAAVLTCR
jgi:hypothetical protein